MFVNTRSTPFVSPLFFSFSPGVYSFWFVLFLYPTEV